MAFVLRIPFYLSPGHALNNLPTSLPINGKEATLECTNGRYLLSVRGFQTAAEAESFFEQVRPSFNWTSLQLETSVASDRELAKVTLREDPIADAENLLRTLGVANIGPVHGLADDVPFVFEESQNIRVTHMGQPVVTLGHPAAAFLKQFQYGLSLPAASGTDEKLRTALDLFQAHFFETSASARFLTLTMCLEALTGGEDKPQTALALLDKWSAELKILKSSASGDDLTGYEALERELVFRREASIRSQVRRIVHESLVRVGAADADDTAKQTLKLYDKRSRLVHEGTLPAAELGDALTEIRGIVRRILEARMTHP